MTEKICGIYMIACSTNGKRYVGKSRDINSRWSHHKGRFRLGKHPNRMMQSSWNAYGSEAFSFFVMEVCSVAELSSRELYWYKTLNPEFNAMSPDPLELAFTHNEESKKKMATARALQVMRPLSENTKAKLSAVLSGRKIAPESLAKTVAWHTGSKRSDETRAKISESLTGRKLSEEHREKLSEAHSGKRKSPESVAKSAAGHVGMKHSDESKTKMVESQRKYQERRKSLNIPLLALQLVV
jgi:group I intron endonuclease